MKKNIEENIKSSQNENSYISQENKLSDLFIKMNKENIKENKAVLEEIKK